MSRIIFIICVTVYFLYNNLTKCYKKNPPTCSRIIDTNRFKNVYDFTKINHYYNTYFLVNYNLCKRSNETIKKLYCYLKIDMDDTKLKDYKLAEDLINNIYHNINIICNSKPVFFDTTDTTLINTVSELCTNFVIQEYNYIFSIIIISIEIIIIITLYYLSYKMYVNKNKKNINFYSYKSDNIINECSICYSDENNDIRELKSCKHTFHKECIDQWISTYNNDTCPNCRICIY